MQKKHYRFLLGAVLVLAVSFGFFTLTVNDPTTAVSFSSFTQTDPTPTGDNPLGAWTAGTPITSPGSNGGAGVGYSKNDTTWLFALNGDVDGSGTAPGQLRAYNFVTNAWTSLANNTGRAWTSMTRIGTKLYNVGGMPSGATAWSQMTGTLQIYDINTNTWTTGTSAPTPIGSTGLDSYQDSLIYAVGGMTITGNPLNNVQLYNINSQSWRAATPLPAARANGWCVIKGDTIYYGCGAGPTTATFNNTIYVGLISQVDRATITWSTSATSYPLAIHRTDGDLFGCYGMIMSPGGNAWWGMGNAVYTWQGGNSAFVSVGPITTTSDAMCGSVFFQRGNYKVWKFAVASGLILAAPYHILNNQIYTDSCLSAPTTIGFCEGFNTTTFPPVGWTLTGSATTLLAYNAVSAYGLGTGSTKADFYSVSSGSRQLNSLTFPTGASLELRFADAYCTFVSENDQLQIQTSTNGGTTWTSLVTLNGGVSGELVTAPPQTSAFTPSSNQWKWQVLALPANTNAVQFNAITAFGNNLYIDSICVRDITGISHNNGIPKNFSLSQNYPNPFNPSTKISFSLPKASDVKLVVFDILGREVATLVNDLKQAGTHNVEFNASALSSGVYFYKIVAGDFTDTKKMLLVK